MEYKITMDYIGGILSDNAYKFSTRGTRPYVRLWMKELAVKANELEIPPAEEYDVKVRGQFLDERRPDLQNLFKIISNAVAKGLGINDKYLHMLDNGYELGFIDPKLLITIIPKETT